MPSVMKTEVLLVCDDLARKDLLLRQYGCQERKKHRNQKVVSEEALKLDPCWKLKPGACTVSTELRSELCL